MKEFTALVCLAILSSLALAQEIGDQLYDTNFAIVLEKLSTTEETPTTNDTQQSANSPSGLDDGPNLDQVEGWLKNFYTKVIGFKNLTVDKSVIIASSEETRVPYMVSFSMETLSNNQSFTSGSPFLTQLFEVRDEIVDEEGGDPSEGWMVDVTQTRQQMDADLVAVEASFRASDLCISDAICPNRDETCSLQSGAITCADKCSVFEIRYPGCTRDPRLDLIYVTGECVLDEDFNPICDCGSSPGDILDNFFDGTECVSAAFVVGMASAGAGFILVVLLSAVIGLAVTKCKQTKKINQLEAELVSRAESNWAAPKPDDRDEYVNIEMTDKSAAGSDKHVHSYPPNIYTNQAYTEDEKPSNQGAPNGVSKPDMSEDPSFGGTDSEFVPQLRHIDPTADYSIKRPSVTIRPTDPFSNDRNSGSNRESAYL